MTLTVATSQFPVCAVVRANRDMIGQQMQDASARGADVIHFPEGALSGYAGVDHDGFDGVDWALLQRCTEEIMAEARTLDLWVLLGSAHRLTGDHNPHNSLYVIDDDGALVDRYDKRFCAGDASEDTGDLAHYTPGTHFAVFDIQGVRCGALICHDCRYPELYREYTRRDVEVMFHAYHAGNIPPERWARMQKQVGASNWDCNPRTTLPGITMPATMRAAAANNHVWISCSTSSAPESCWPAFVVRPDGVATGTLTRNEAGVLVSTLDLEAAHYDSSGAWRERAMSGVYHSGTPVDDPRSDARTAL